MNRLLSAWNTRSSTTAGVENTWRPSSTDQINPLSVMLPVAVGSNLLAGTFWFVPEHPVLDGSQWTRDPHATWVGHAGVPCGGLQVLVAQQLLDGTQLDALLQQVGGEGMPQRMGGDAGR